MMGKFGCKIKLLTLYLYLYDLSYIPSHLSNEPKPTVILSTVTLKLKKIFRYLRKISICLIILI